MTVLILAHASDAIADRIGAELAIRGVPIVRLNLSAFPSRLSMAARITASETWTGNLTTDDGTLVDLAEIRSVWMRRASQFVMDERMSVPERAFAYGEARRGLGGVLAALSDCLWINDPMAAARAEYKPVQLAAAAEVKLTIPETLVASDPEYAYTWAKQRRVPIIYKPMSGVWHADEGQLRVMYTTVVDDLDRLREPSFALTAQLLQEQVVKAYEVRAVVIDEDVWAVRIDAASSAARTDWRADYDALSYALIDLPAEVAARLVELHKRLGLVYGAVDMIVTPDGEHVFLETNQGGEFGWLAEETGAPIPAGIADLLENGAA